MKPDVIDLVQNYDNRGSMARIHLLIDELPEPFADRVLENLYRYAPNMRDHILERVVITPLDLQRDYGVTGGNIFHGAMFLEQLFGNRPIPALADYRTRSRATTFADQARTRVGA